VRIDYYQPEKSHILLAAKPNKITLTYTRCYLLRLHKIDLGMNEHDIKNELDIAKHKELQNLQCKVDYLRNEIHLLEF
jgi:hypothetical protein